MVLFSYSLVVSVESGTVAFNLYISMMMSHLLRSRKPEVRLDMSQVHRVGQVVVRWLSGGIPLLLAP